jgi:hypothetical protein
LKLSPISWYSPQRLKWFLLRFLHKHEHIPKFVQCIGSMSASILFINKLSTMRKIYYPHYLLFKHIWCYLNHKKVTTYFKHMWVPFTILNWTSSGMLKRWHFHFFKKAHLQLAHPRYIRWNVFIHISQYFSCNIHVKK